MSTVTKLKTRPSNHETFRGNILFILHDFFLGKCTRSSDTSCLFSSLAFWVSACVAFLKLFSLLNSVKFILTEEVRFQLYSSTADLQATQIHGVIKNILLAAIWLLSFLLQIAVAGLMSTTHTPPTGLAYLTAITLLSETLFVIWQRWRERTEGEENRLLI